MPRTRNERVENERKKTGGEYCLVSPLGKASRWNELSQKTDLRRSKFRGGRRKSTWKTITITIILLVERCHTEWRCVKRNLRHTKLRKNKETPGPHRMSLLIAHRTLTNADHYALRHLQFFRFESWCARAFQPPLQPVDKLQWWWGSSRLHVWHLTVCFLYPPDFCYRLFTFSRGANKAQAGPDSYPGSVRRFRSTRHGFLSPKRIPNFQVGVPTSRLLLLLFASHHLQPTPSLWMTFVQV